MTRIEEVKARQVFDSRGNPTVEVDVYLESGIMGRGTVPSGASTGKFEALELRDGDPDRLNGRGVSKAVEKIDRVIAPAIRGMDVLDQAAVDQTLIKLDGTENKSNLGANATLGVSMATAKAGAKTSNMPLYRYLGGVNAKVIPVPLIQIINGGLHANRASDIQAFEVIPTNSSSFTEGYEMAVNVYNSTKKVFDELEKPLSVADEGGLWPTLDSNEEGIELLIKGINKAGYTPGKDLSIHLDVASSHFYEDELYRLELENREMSRGDFVDYLCGLVSKYPIISIEDGMADSDLEGWKMLSEKLGSRIQLIGDDLFATNISRIKKGVDLGIANSVLIKMTQIGTLTETLDAIEFTKKTGYLPVVSARSGETEDTTMVHLAIASNAGQVRVGSVARTDRVAKWNEIIRVEEQLGDSGGYLAHDLL